MDAEMKSTISIDQYGGSFKPTSRITVFERVRFVGVDFGGTRFSCDFTRASLKLIPGEARFERCIFDHSNINGWQTGECSFVDSTFVGPISNVIFYGTPPVWTQREDPPAPNDFIGNDFSAAELNGVEFRRADQIVSRT